MERAQAEEAARNQHSDASPAESLGESRRLRWLVASPLAQQFQGSLDHLHRQALQAGNADTSESSFEPDFLGFGKARAAAASALRRAAPRVERGVLFAAQGLARELDQMVRHEAHAEHGIDLAAPQRAAARRRPDGRR